MTLEELDENEDEFGEDDEAAIEMYRWVKVMQVGEWCTEQLPDLYIILYCGESPANHRSWTLGSDIFV